MAMTTTMIRRAEVGRSTRRRGAILFFALGAFFSTSALAARESVNFSSPFEVSDSPSGNYLAAMIAGADHDTVAAATFFREALRFDPRNPQLIERAFVAALSNGNMVDAFALGDRLIARDPGNSLARLTLGIKAFRAKQYSAARAQLAKGGTNQQRDITATLVDAWSFAGGGDEKKALEYCDRLRDDNFAVFRNFHAGLIADVMNDVPEAQRRLKAAYDADKKTLRLVDAYGRFVSRHGDKAEALRIYQDFNTLAPNQPMVTSALATLKAGKILEPLLKNADQGAAEVLYGLGAAGGGQGDDVASMIYLRLSLYLAPQNSLTLLQLADISDRMKQYEQSIATYESVPSGDVMRTTADIQIAQMLDNLNKHEEAEKYRARIVASHPNDEDALFALGNSQRAQKKFTDAVATYTKVMAISTKPEKSNWVLYYFRGIAYESAKMWPQAEADFRKGLELFPDQSSILNYLGYSWVDRGLNLDEAFKMLHKAVELNPSDGYIVDSLGWALFKLGKYDEAVKELERAIDLKPGDPTVNDHLGDAYWRTGRKLEAHFQWNHARDLKPEPDELPKITAKIEHGLPDEKPPVAADANKPAATDAPAPRSGG